MKMTAKAKQPFKAKPGQLMSTHIEYGEGDSASVRHEHAPEASKPGAGAQFMGMGASPSLSKHFSSRAEALHHAAEHAGVVANLEDQPEPDDEGEEENEMAGAGVGDLKSAKPFPTRKKVGAQTSGGGTAGKAGLPG